MKQVELKSTVPLYGGLCLSHHDGVIFLRGTIPGETVIADIREKKRDYSIADAVEIVEKSDDRIDPFCPVFGNCGGCHYQHISYERQISIKEEVLLDCLRRIANIEITISEILKGEQWHYRNKAQLKVDSNGKIGFYSEGSRDIVQFDECFIVGQKINQILKRIKRLKPPSGIQDIHILTGINTIVFIKGRKLDEKILDMFMDIGVEGVVLDNGLHKGDEYCSLSMENLSIKPKNKNLHSLVYTVSPRGFFQSNWNLNIALIQRLNELLGDIKDELVLDVYGGGGNFSLSIASKAEKILVIDDNPYSIIDGERNVQINKIKNIRFKNKTFEKIKKLGFYNTVILDPPRRGLSNTAIERLLSIDPEKIFYLSCNPATFARDVAKITNKYNLTSIMLIDMFPNTYHIESLGIFAKK